ARHLLPHRLVTGVAEADPTVGHRIGEKDAPAIFRHPDHAIARPAPPLVDRGRGAEIDLRTGKSRRPHLLPPVRKVRLPMFEGPLQRPVVGKINVVGDPLAVIEPHNVTSPYTRCRSKRTLAPLP